MLFNYKNVKIHQEEKIMIIDKLENAEFYYGLGEKYKKAFEFLKNTDMKNLENGKHEIDSDEIFIAVQDYQTKSEYDAEFEAHKKYTDIQFIITGEEKLGYGNIENFSETTDFDEEKDIVFLKNNEPKNEFAIAKENYFLIFTPQDAHMPCISINNATYVKKAVVKIKN